jgi:hypothetical protein
MVVLGFVFHTWSSIGLGFLVSVDTKKKEKKVVVVAPTFPLMYLGLGGIPAANIMSCLLYSMLVADTCGGCCTRPLSEKAMIKSLNSNEHGHIRKRLAKSKTASVIRTSEEVAAEIMRVGVPPTVVQW